MKLLQEFVGWINTVNEVEFLTEGKGHMDHPEDMVILGGLAGYMPSRNALGTMERAAQSPAAITIKFDGYPALVFGSGPDGKFSILDKHMFNRGANRPKIYSPQDFANYEAARGEKGRSELVALVTKIWPSLQRSYRGKGWYMGDLIFHNVLQENNGVYSFRPNPNGILYKVQADSELGKYLAGKTAGIAVHRWLEPTAANTEDNVTWLSDLGNLKPQGDVAILPVSMPVTPTIRLNKSLKAKAEGTTSSEQNIYDFISGAPQNASTFANMFTVYLNNRIVQGDMKNLYNGFFTWVKDRLDKQLAAKAISPKMYTALTEYLKSNTAVIKQLFKNWIDVYNYKMDIVKQIDTAAKESPIKGYLQNGQESQEGFVYGGLKFVDRQGFSAQNLAARQKQPVAEDSAPGKLVVIYAGGFQPFHKGHLSSYLQAKKAFPGADFYVATSGNVKERPIPYKEKQFLASQAGVAPQDFPDIVVKSPLKPTEILSNYNPEKDVFVLVRSERDPVDYTRKDGTPGYFQPWTGKNPNPFGKNGYVYVTKKHNFEINGQEVYSGTQVRNMYQNADDAGRKQIVKQLYPDSRQQSSIKKILDKYIGGLQEADNPNYFGGSSQSAIPGTPQDLMPGPSKKDIAEYHKEMADLKRFMGRR